MLKLSVNHLMVLLDQYRGTLTQFEIHTRNEDLQVLQELNFLNEDSSVSKMGEDFISGIRTLSGNYYVKEVTDKKQVPTKYQTKVYDIRPTNLEHIWQLWEEDERTDSVILVCWGKKAELERVREAMVFIEYCKIYSLFTLTYMAGAYKR